MRRYALRSVALVLSDRDPDRAARRRLLPHVRGRLSAGAWEALSAPDTIHAFKLTLIITAIAVPLNTVFGIVCALAIVRKHFPGKGLLNAFIDLPLALSPVVVGLSLFLLFGRTGWFGGFFERHDIQVLFALPAMIIATIFVSLPFVAREVVPTLREIGDEQEQAAQNARSERLADLPPDHAAVDPLGGDLRRHPHDRSLPRRVRRRRRRLGTDSGADGDGDAACRGALRQLRSRGRLRASRSCSR